MIDAYVRNQYHYLPYAAAVLRAVPEDRRGTLYCDGSWGEFGPLVPDLASAPGHPPADTADPVIVAGGPDLDGIGNRPAIYVEHGAGQSYADRPDHVSYSGGAGRDSVALYLVPNEWTRAKCIATQPLVPAVIIGDPTLDTALRTERPTTAEAPTVAVTFHWDAHAVAPEAGTGWHAWAWPVLQLAQDPAWRVLGHAHPRIAYQLSRWWAEHGIEYEPDRDLVLRRADVLVADNTSLIWQAARLGIPTVVLDCPFYRPDAARHGPPRFSEHADAGERIQLAEQLPAAIRAAIQPPADTATRRQALADDVYPHIGQDAAARARDAILTIWP